MLSRWRGPRATGASGPPASADQDWTETFQVELQPNPALSPGQRDAVAWEYDMPGGRAALWVRKALLYHRKLLYHLKKRLRLDRPDDPPSETPVVVANRQAFEIALARAKGLVREGV